MAVTNWKLPTSYYTWGVKGSGWTNPSYILLDDGNYAVAPLMDGGTTACNTMCAHVFDLQSEIPDGATIDGIEVLIKRYAGISDSVYDNQVVLGHKTIVDGNPSLSIESSNYASALKWPITVTEKIYGGSSDKWGIGSLTKSFFDSNFSAAIDMKSILTASAYIDCIKVRVYYTPLPTLSLKDGNVSILTQDGLMKVQGMSILTDAGWKKTNQFLFVN